ncbi:DUF4350 domain-containing protein [Haladaptatus sp. GCM10025707]|uniref:DUF4350 domain-containing protein n=1 Tax=unclassified Haladaptatus TaxID=2622732 RepID=UPI0023E7C392|nr:DUF4350 domain-containing protein [Haladaptatus sp. QDMS2]
MNWRDLDIPRVVLVVLVVLTASAAVVGASTSTASFGVYNPAWDGASDLRGVADDTGTKTTLVRNTSRYVAFAPSETVAFVLSPDDAYTPAQQARLRAFVEGGGTLVVAEDYGMHSNDLLAGLGATARFDGTPVRDERRNYQSPAIPVANNVSAHPLANGSNALVLNHGTVVEANNATVLARTSEFAYLDANRNDALDETESVGTYPVATVEQVGAGQVVAVSDPSAFINAMLDRPGNRAFAEALVSAHDQLLLDYSHADQLPPLAVAVVILRESALVQALVGVLGLGAVLLVSRRVVGSEDEPAVDRSVGLTSAEVEAYLARRHPDWESRRIERVTQGIIVTEEEAEER